MAFMIVSKLVLLLALFSFFLPLIYSLPYIPRIPADSCPLRILPLGDSITWGWQPAHQQNGTNGYRAQLLADLTSSHYTNIDFVGTQHSGTMVDNENEGHPGFTISQIHSVMGTGLALRPNVVLLHAGTNDLNRPETAQEPWADAPKRLGSVIDDVLKVCPDAVIIVAKIIQAKNAQTASNLKAFNAAIPGIVEERVKKGHKVTFVDQSVVGVDELVDGLHPTDAGYAHMGHIWFQGVKAASEEGLITSPVQYLYA